MRYTDCCHAVSATVAAAAEKLCCRADFVVGRMETFFFFVCVVPLCLLS